MNNKIKIYILLIVAFYIVEIPLKYCASSFFQKVDLPGGFELNTWSASFFNPEHRYPFYYDIVKEMRAINTLSGCPNRIGKNMMGYSYNKENIFIFMETCDADFIMYVIDVKLANTLGPQEWYYQFSYKDFIKSKYYEEYQTLDWHSFDTCHSTSSSLLNLVHIILFFILVIWTVIFIVREIKKLKNRKFKT